MGRNLKERISKYLTRQRQRKLGYSLLASLGAVVVFCTTYALILPAITMSNDPICGYEAHTHTESCWSLVTLDPDPELICTDWMEADVVYHAHDQLCYDQNGQLICPIQERALHQHDQSCFVEEKQLVCGLEGVDEEIAAQLPESVITPQPVEPEVPDPVIPAHVHGAACYTLVQGALICGQEESEGHFHTSDCFEERPIEGQFRLICGLEETPFVEVEIPENDLTGFSGLTGMGGHVHTDACYEPEMETVQICGMDEGGGHYHDDSCYEWNEELTCGQEGVDEATARALELLVRQQEEQQQPEEVPAPEELHIHTAECYQVTLTQVCLEEDQLHTHGPACYETRETFDELGNVTGSEEVLVCTLPVAVEHQHTQDCIRYQVNQELSEAMELTCGMEVHVHTDACYIERELESDPYFCGVTEHTHTEECFFESGELRCTMPEHIHTEECLDPSSAPEPEYPIDGEPEKPDYICGIEEHVHDEEKCFVNGYLVCGVPEHTHDETCLREEAPDGEENPDGGEEPGLPEESGPVTIAFNDFVYETETDEFHLTFHINGVAALAAEETDGVLDPAGSGGWTDSALSAPLDGGLTDGEDGIERFESGLTSYSAWDESGGLENGEPVPAPEEDGVQFPEFAAPEEDGVPFPEAPAPEENGVQLPEPGMPETDGEPVSRWTPEDVEFRLETVTEGEEYEAIMAQAGEIEGQQLMLQVMQVKAYVDGRELDLSECTITIEMRPKTALPGQAADGAAADQEDGVMTFSASAVSEAPYEGFEDAADGESGVEDAAESEEDVLIGSIITKDEIDSIDFGEEDADQVGCVTVRGGEPFATRVANVTDALFYVQYFANMDKIERTPGAGDAGNRQLTLIDTSNGGTGQGGILPQTGTINETHITIGSDGKMVTVTGADRLTKLYEAREYHYVTHPNLKYFNIVSKVENYELKEVWILRSDLSDALPKAGDSASMTEEQRKAFEAYDQKTDKNESDSKGKIWTVYSEADTPNAWGDKLHFTNREASAGEKEGGTYILIKDNTFIRLVYDQTSMAQDFSATFYDYDISSGTENPVTGNSFTLLTKKAGINSDSNYTSSGVKFAFGNSGQGTGLGAEEWNGYTINKASTAYGGCSFGLVQGINSSANDVIFSDGIVGPSLFGSGSAAGKYPVAGLDAITFQRVGDTYTLSAVPGTNVTNLDTGWWTRPNWNKTRHFWSNSFWPLDNITVEGAVDPKYGSDGGTQKYKGITDDNSNTEKTERLNEADEKGYAENVAYPVSLDHNSFFGMQFGLTFELTKDYCGPLEYYFFGDDDMWVFLDGRLVCDIGGVHSAIGEYVNLWDYISRDSLRDLPDGQTQRHELRFFYTERGASGSTCWMQFTLPSVVSDSIPLDTGGLRIEKEVAGAVTDQEFEFTVELTDASGRGLMDDYSYSRYQKGENGDTLIESNLILSNFQENNENKFYLRGGEYIVVNYLPAGTQWTITEAEDSIYHTTTTQNGTVTAGNTATGTIAAGNQGSLKFTNQASYVLPETGGPSAILYTAGGGLLMAAAGSLLYKKKAKRRGAVDRT